MIKTTHLTAESIIDQIKYDSIVAEIKKLSMTLSDNYTNNIKIEINVNQKMKSCKINLTEFNL